MIGSRRNFLRCGLAMAGAAMLRPISGVAGEQWTLTLYNGQHAQTTKAVVAGFLESTGIAVTVRNGSSAQLASQIAEEGAHSPADVFFSEESPPLVALADKGLLAPVDPETLQQIPAVFSAADGTWVGASARCRVVAYNKTMVEETDLPPTIMDFAKPEWKGKVAIVPTSGAFQEQIVAVLKLEGRKAALAWLKGLKENGAIYNSNSAAMKAVEAGDIATALINNYYWFSLAAELGADNMKSALHYMGNQDAGALVTVSGAGILKSAKNPDAAQKFLAYLVSEEGQKIIVKAMAEYPVRAGIESPYALKPMYDLEPPDISAADVGDAAEADALQREVGLI